MKKTMIQAVMEAPGRIAFREVEIPPLQAGEIRVRLRRIGVCGSDIHVWHGKHPYTSYPVVQGHEVAATVEETGPGVTGFEPGDTVTIQPQVVCGRCHPCTHGLYNDCNELKVMGFQTTGMASEYFVVAAEKALKLPEGMSFEHGALIEPLAVACHAVARFGDVTDKRLLVIGGGPIGNLIAQTLKAKGARQVLLSEVSASRLAIAHACGIETFDPTRVSMPDAVLEAFGPDSADGIFECIGSAKVIREIVDFARKGSTIVVVGVVPDLCEINLGFVQDHELNLIGTAMYRVEDYREAIRLVFAGRIALDALITHRVPFRAYESAYRIVEEQKDRCMKVMIVMDGETVHESGFSV